MAITSEGFCQSAKLAFFLILRNCARFLAVESICGVFILIGKIVQLSKLKRLGKFAIAGTSAFLCYLIMTNYEDINDELYSAIFPTIVKRN
jgi:hypothetical protein